MPKVPDRQLNGQEEHQVGNLPEVRIKERMD
jgi:hypothetical protein